MDLGEFFVPRILRFHEIAPPGLPSGESGSRENHQIGSRRRQSWKPGANIRFRWFSVAGEVAVRSWSSLDFSFNNPSLRWCSSLLRASISRPKAFRLDRLSNMPRAYGFYFHPLSLFTEAVCYVHHSPRTSRLPKPRVF